MSPIMKRAFQWGALTGFAVFFMMSTALNAAPDEQKKIYQRATKSFIENYGKIGAENLLEFAQEAYDAADKTYQKHVASYHLGLVNASLNNKEEAIKYFSEAVETAGELQGEEKKSAIAPLLQLSKMYVQMSMLGKAKSSAKKLLDLADEYLEEGHIDRAGIYMQVAEINYHRRKYSSARKYYSKAKNMYETTYGLEDYRTVWPDFFIGKTYLTQGKYGKSREIFSKIIDDFEGSVPADDLLLISSRTFLVQIYEKTDKSDEATKHCRAIAYAKPRDTLEDEKALFLAKPYYPQEALRKKVPGHVILEFTVSDEGKVRDVEVLSGINTGMFRREAIKTVKKFRYAPAVKDGKIIEVRVKHKIFFEIGY